ncbi:hypothetical protein DH2020_025869 [Rehmannia glutinosa]|uniref:Myb/SANT-like DNA-binding domain-containing protein n=1 Tax=Rehmannia glutinosa TaxID=99300 RepID=A0ABR0W2S1_REHGL
MENHHHQVLKQQQETPSSLLSQNHNKEIITSDRLKRDEWSEGAVSSLLEAYEAKWALRNRAKLKGQDWEEVAQHVSGRAGGSKSAKTQTQCKNKIESMKKRYRSESAAADGSSWPLYSRLDLLLRGNHGRPAAAAAAANPPSVVVEELPSVPPPPPPASVVVPSPILETAVISPAVLGQGSVAQDSRGADCGDRVAKEEGDGIKLTNGHESEKNPLFDDTDSSTPAIYTEKQVPNTKAPSKKSKGERKLDKPILKRTREEYCWEIGESIRWVAEVVVRSEQARLETMKEIERMRAKPTPREEKWTSSERRLLPILNSKLLSYLLKDPFEI